MTSLASAFYRSRLFRSVHLMPSVEDAYSRRDPVVDTWNDLYQERGLAAVGVDAASTAWPELATYFSIMAGRVPTHWRWREDRI